MGIFIVKASFDKRNDKMTYVRLYDTNSRTITDLDSKTLVDLVRHGRFTLSNAEISRSGDINISAGNGRFYGRIDKRGLYICRYAYLVEKYDGYYRIIVGQFNDTGCFDKSGPFDILDDIYNIKNHKLMFANAMVCGNKKQGYYLEYLNSYQNEKIVNTVNNEFKDAASLHNELVRQGFDVELKYLPQGLCLAFIEHNGIGEFKVPTIVKYLGRVNGGINRLLLPSSLTGIDRRCCAEVDDLFEVAIAKNSPIRIIPEETFCSSGLKKITGMQNIEELKAGAFYDCRLKGTLNLPSVKIIGKKALCSTDITEAILPNVEIIKGSGLRSCYKLEKVELGDKLKGINSYAFADDYRLKEITIPNSTLIIKKFAFYGCTALKTIKLSRNTKVEDNAIPKKTKKIYVD